MLVYGPYASHTHHGIIPNFQEKADYRKIISTNILSDHFHQQHVFCLWHSSFTVHTERNVLTTKGPKNLSYCRRQHIPVGQTEQAHT